MLNDAISKLERCNLETLKKVAREGEFYNDISGSFRS
jgi:hypothetical protein